MTSRGSALLAVLLAPVIAAAAPAADEMQDIRDIRGPIVEPGSVVWWPYAAGVLAVVLAALAVRAILRRRRRPLPPHERAVRELAATRTMIDRGDPHGFSIGVSNTVRSYVEEAFAVRAPRRTTEELLADLMTDGSPVAAYRGELGSFLELCDLAKYARWSLSRGEMTRMVDTAEAFVRATAVPAGGRP